MKLWRVNVYEPFEGCCVSWHSSKEKAATFLKSEQSEREFEAAGPEGIEEVTIPTDKAGLIDWLNRNLNRDNG